MAKNKNKKQQQQRSHQAPPLRRPETNELAVAQVTDKYSEYPSNGLTPQKLAEIFREADAGDVLRQMELFEEIEEKDPHLFSQLQTRKNAVTGLDFEIIPFDSDDPRDKEIADFIESQIGSLESLEDVMTDLLDAIGKGFSVSEIMWGYDEGHVVVNDIRSRHQKRFFWDTVDDSFKVRTKEAPDGTTIDFITTEKASSTDLYERLARYCDEQISKAILGQTLTSDSGGGSFAQSKTHNEVRHDLTVADCKALAATLRRDLIRPLCIFNFGEDKRIPYLRFDCEESEDLEQTANILGTLIEKTGLKVPTSYIYKKFSIPKPEGDEEVATPSPPQIGGYGGMQLKQLELKEPSTAPIGTQQRIDKLADVAVKRSAGSFKKAFSPVLKMIEKAGSLEELRDMMEDDKQVASLLDQMDVSQVEELLQKVMLYADLEGRVVNNE